MPQRHLSLTGSWSGAYRYPGDSLPETVFSARIEEANSAFTGDLSEPNVLDLGSGAVINSDIEGVRDGAVVAFTKFYNGSGGLRHAVRYKGTANIALTRIAGNWIIPGEWSGTFFMTRDDDGEADAIEREAEADIEADR